MSSSAALSAFSTKSQDLLLHADPEHPLIVSLCVCVRVRTYCVCGKVRKVVVDVVDPDNGGGSVGEAVGRVSLHVGGLEDEGVLGDFLKPHRNKGGLKPFLFYFLSHKSPLPPTLDNPTGLVKRKTSPLLRPCTDHHVLVGLQRSGVDVLRDVDMLEPLRSLFCFQNVLFL